MRRRRMGFRSGRKRRATDWIVSAEGFVTDPLPVTGSNNLITLIDSTDLDDHDDELTVIRIVGQVHYWLATTDRIDASAPPITRGYAGIYKTEADQAGAVIELQADDGIDADSEAWLWRNSWIDPSSFQSYSPDTGNALTSTGWGFFHTQEIDCRVMRKMGGREHLVFAYRIFSNSANPEYQALFQLRTLVKLV